ncbi:MAG: M28 family metallopeptidase [Sphingomonadales bacterium]
MTRTNLFAAAVCAALASCGQQETTSGPEAGTITADDLARHIEILASDAFGGRGPASPGEEKTTAYLKDEFERLGLKPANGDSFFQAVPLVEITADPDTSIKVTGGSKPLELAYSDDAMVWTTRVVDQVAVENSDMVFVGYGVVAPEYGWDDYAGLDVEGKTVVILVNDPGYATQDPALFNGNTMTYYGRWDYKFEEAARQGAAAALIVHETRPAAYPWEVVTGSWSGPQFDLVRADKNMSRVAVEGWINRKATEALFAQASLDFDAMKAAALKKDFKAVSLGLKASVSVRNSLRETISNNVVAVLPGADRPDEYLIYMAHWDHLGADPAIEGDGIYNGALDNASGVAALLELAEAFASLEDGPGRSVIFAAVTAEEQGLLGSAHYANDPLAPLAQTVAGINMDGLSNIGRTREITVVGHGMSELESFLEEAAAGQGREVRPEPFPEKGYYYRSDHFNLAKKGVPMLYTEAGVDSIEHGAEWGKAQADKYLAERYHKPADEFDDSWDLSGGVEDVKLFLDVGLKIANGTGWPNWNEGTEFRAIRNASRAGE